MRSRPHKCRRRTRNRDGIIVQTEIQKATITCLDMVPNTHPRVSWVKRDRTLFGRQGLTCQGWSLLTVFRKDLPDAVDENPRNIACAAPPGWRDWRRRWPWRGPMWLRETWGCVALGGQRCGARRGLTATVVLLDFLQNGLQRHVM